MDGQRFDELTRALATTSRRQVVKALAGGVASGLLTVLSGQEASAASCRGRPDFTPCGECKHCRNGRCVAGFDGLNCRACGTCQDGRCRSDDRRCGECQRCRGHGRRCVPDPRQDLHPCGSDCHVCSGGTCVPLSDGSACLTGDGTCCGGTCTTEACCPACPQCQQCEDGACVPDPGQEGQLCAGTECGDCFLGECRPDSTRCPDLCLVCDEATLTCVPLPEGAPCGPNCETCQNGKCVGCNECQACIDNRCVGDPNKGLQECGTSGCHVCAGDDSGSCIPVGNGSDCHDRDGTCCDGVCVTCNECQRCGGGQCVEDPEKILHDCGTSGCHVCAGDGRGSCIPVGDGSDCADRDGTCCGGVCVDLQSDPNHCGSCNRPCPTGERCCGGTCQPENCPCPSASDFTANQLCCPFGHEACGDVCCDPTAGEKCTSEGCCSIRRNESPCGPGFDPLNDLICCGPDETCCIGEGGKGYCCPGEPFTMLTCCFGGCCPEGWTCNGDCFHAHGRPCCPPSGPGYECSNCLPPSPGRRA